MKRNHCICTMLLLAMTGAFTVAQPTDTEPARKPPAPLSLELMRLDAMAGLWGVVERHFLPDGTVVEREGREKVTWTLDTKAIRREYDSGKEPSIFRAEAIMTWSPTLKKYFVSWYDTNTNGPTSSSCEWETAVKSLVCMAETIQPDGTRQVSHKVVERLADGNKRISTTFVKDGDAWVKRMEVVYTRLQSCPERDRLIHIRDLG